MAHVQSVLGPIDPASLGMTLPHEHTQIALWHIEARWDYWQLTRDAELIAKELAAFRAMGGRTIVDLTLPGVGRDPDWLVALARTTELNIVMGCGWYRTAYYPPDLLVDRRSVDSLADSLVEEIERGVGDGGVRPGIIGEIGTDKPWVSALEERVHRAAARASRRTGMAITTHGVQSDVGLAQLRIFTEEGVDPSRVVIGHADSHHDIDFYLEVLATGANLQFDFLGHRFGVEEAMEPRLVETIVELLERGFAPQLLLSQDVCHNRQLKAYGGFGYVDLHQHVLPTLRTAAVGEGEIRQLTIDNPARILTIP
jgi:predicted metal-dependent phosphotriesterase family hydrolase